MDSVVYEHAGAGGEFYETQYSAPESTGEIARPHAAFHAGEPPLLEGTQQQMQS